ncbi:amidohydrolase family protein, partial [Roseisolibacter sp. H3M3-2]|uniref:amidohydrolase family protein n=1 Tax=Roseisolibacter sp. H3M3-2 TaxID=3031323 RepID=UPI0023DA5D6B
MPSPRSRPPRVLPAALLVVLTAGRAPAQEPAPPEPPPLAIVGATVLPMDDARVLERHTVVMRGGRIVAVAPDAEARVPADARRVDGRGRWLVPGLVDMHVHLDGAGRERDLPLYLAHGVTTVRNLRGTPEHVALRARIARGELLGPTLLTSGPFVDRLPEATPAEQVVRDHRAAGYDVLKVHDREYAPERYRALARAARAAGMPLVGHVPVAVGVEAAVREGQRTLEHAEDLMQTFFAMQLDTARLPALVAAVRGGRACVVPTLVVFGTVARHLAEYPDLRGLMARPALRHVRPALRDAWAPERNPYVLRAHGRAAEAPAIAARLAAQNAFLHRIAGALHAGGVPVAAGSDAGVPHTIPGHALVEEVAQLRAAGLSPHDALRDAARAAAERLPRADEFAAIVPGLRADAVLLDLDPRADPGALADTARSRIVAMSFCEPR